MNDGLILSFLPEWLITRIEQGEETLSGTWIAEIAPDAIFVGRDKNKRVEVFVSFSVFEQIKTNLIFQYKCQGLRRVRTSKRTPLGLLLFPQYAEFDNELE